MAQNIYDDPGFFAAYGRLPRSVSGLSAAPEWPVLQSMLPPLAGLRILDLGCGFGWFSRYAREQGAASALGVDVSKNMLARAREATSDPAIAYVRADLDDEIGLDAIRADAFDLAYSSLTLHYVANLPRLVASVHAALTPGGRFVFSIEHPLFTAPSRPDWTVDADGRARWLLDGYLDEGPRRTNWLADGVVKQHRATATYLRALIEAGFALRRLEEWAPSAEQIALNPDWARERERPSFLLIACDRS